MKEILNVFESLAVDKTVLIKILISIFIILFVWLIRRSIVRIVNRRVKDPRTRYNWRKALNYTAIVLNLLFLGFVWFRGFQPLATYLGLLSAGISIALKDPIVDIAAWIFIMTNRPFKLGDRIEVNGHIGDVIDIGVFQFILLEVGNWVDADQSTGRIIHIPNGTIITGPLVNYTEGFPYVWNEIPVLVTFESDWRKAKKILLEIAEKYSEKISDTAKKSIEKASKRFVIIYKHTKPIVYTSVNDSGVLLTVRYLCRIKNRRGSAEVISEDILDAFGKSKDIDFAYPTQRFYDNTTEGKPGTKTRNIK